ncbi:MAG: hypothetical protein R3Y43_04575 [Alphaproteobacteria bacterium]
MKKICVFLMIIITSACSTSPDEGEGQIVYHWERRETGIEKFSRDHSQCLKFAENFKLFPDVSSWFYTEEAKNNIIVDWHSQKGVWATYVPYRGAQPLIINSLVDDAEISPKKYRICMEDMGYINRVGERPEITNIFVYSPQRVLGNKPYSERKF